MTERTRALVKELYAAYGRRDFDRVAAFIHENIDWIINAPTQVFPFVGHRQGKLAVLEASAGIAREYAIDRYQPEVIIVEGDRAAVISDVSFIQRTTGRTLRVRLVNFLRFQDDRVIEFREFANTFDLVEQALGREVDLSALARA